jgi:hypothetical protein
MVGVRKSLNWIPSSKIIKLPSPEILKLSISKILASFDDIVQVELMKTRWEEIKKLQTLPAM